MNRQIREVLHAVYGGSHDGEWTFASSAVPVRDVPGKRVEELEQPTIAEGLAVVTHHALSHATVVGEWKHLHKQHS